MGRGALTSQLLRDTTMLCGTTAAGVTGIGRLWLGVAVVEIAFLGEAGVLLASRHVERHLLLLLAIFSIEVVGSFTGNVKSRAGGYEVTLVAEVAPQVLRKSIIVRTRQRITAMGAR